MCVLYIYIVKKIGYVHTLIMIIICTCSGFAVLFISVHLELGDLKVIINIILNLVLFT